MEQLYPLIFNPIVKEKLWGGKNLSRILNKPQMSDSDGESWELSGVPGNISVFVMVHLLEKFVRTNRGI